MTCQNEAYGQHITVSEKKWSFMVSVGVKFCRKWPKSVKNEKQQLTDNTNSKSTMLSSELALILVEKWSEVVENGQNR